jgi:SAM-dependent methyltransferase
MAYYIIKELGLKTGDQVLDYGCGKGYVTKALRLLGIDARGVDVSEYAVGQADPDTRDFVALITNDNPMPWRQKFDWLITKDVLEHVPDQPLNMFLENYSSLANNMWHVIPLGDNGVFRIPEYHLDRSHVQINDELWWTTKFKQYGWPTVHVKHRVQGIKDNWAERNSQGDGFFTLKK